MIDLRKPFPQTLEDGTEVLWVDVAAAARKLQKTQYHKNRDLELIANRIAEGWKLEDIGKTIGRSTERARQLALKICLATEIQVKGEIPDEWGWEGAENAWPGKVLRM